MRKVTVLVLMGAVVAFVMKKLRGNPAPQFSNHPTVKGGPSSEAAAAADAGPLPDLVPAPEDPTVAAKATPALVPAPKDPTVPTAAPTTTRAAPAEQTWAEPVDGECPDGFPVKAKIKSGIFHVPGTPTYERTKPDRCYPSAQAAEADGLRAPKR